MAHQFLSLVCACLCVVAFWDPFVFVRILAQESRAAFALHCPAAMGSLPEGTLCAYCGLREAGYIPDGCCGPLCFGESDSDEEDAGTEAKHPACSNLGAAEYAAARSCNTLAQIHGWGVVEAMRLDRLWRGTVSVLSKSNQALASLANRALQHIVAGFLWRT